eukprot:10164799-Alexandrium_andersonii.AAC.1
MPKSTTSGKPFACYAHVVRGAECDKLSLPSPLSAQRLKRTWASNRDLSLASASLCAASGPSGATVS